MIKFFVFFLIINFGALALGGWLMDNGPMTDWYIQLNKAPWTPPGWVFGVAWTTIMICFSIYLAQLFSFEVNSKIVLLFALQVFLNIIWNFLFFNKHLILSGLIVLVLLTVLILYFFFNFNQGKISYYRFFLLPYIFWLFVAISLNAYILIYNK